MLLSNRITPTFHISLLKTVFPSCIAHSPLTKAGTQPLMEIEGGSVYIAQALLNSGKLNEVHHGLAVV